MRRKNGILGSLMLVGQSLAPNSSSYFFSIHYVLIYKTIYEYYLSKLYDLLKSLCD